MNEHYDIIIIGTGAGGGTLAHRLAPSGKKILILERGTFLPREKDNWNPVEVTKKDRYFNAETWQDKEVKELKPATGYWVGGNTKFFGGTLFRAREREFDTVIHKGGISPEWCLKYADFEPYYTQAEKLYNVHGKRGLDPIEPWTTEEYSFPPISHEPYGISENAGGERLLLGRTRFPLSDGTNSTIGQSQSRNV
jgi:choline dehydrogenase-like flavoprotein